MFLGLPLFTQCVSFYTILCHCIKLLHYSLTFYFCQVSLIQKTEIKSITKTMTNRILTERFFYFSLGSRFFLLFISYLLPFTTLPHFRVVSKSGVCKQLTSEVQSLPPPLSLYRRRECYFHVVSLSPSPLVCLSSLS